MFCSVLICLVLYSHLYLIVIIYFVEIFEPVLTSTYSTYSALLYILRTDLNARPVKNTQPPCEAIRAHLSTFSTCTCICVVVISFFFISGNFFVLLCFWVF